MWIISVPAIVFVIIAMLVGNIQPGLIIRVIGILVLIGGGITFLVSLDRKGDDKSDLIKAAVTFLVLGILILLLGIWFGGHTLLEFLFGDSLF